MSHWRVKRKARLKAYLHELCGTTKPQHENGDAPFHATHKWIQQETGEPRTPSCVVFHALQLLPRPQNAARYSRNGSWVDQSRLDARRTDCVDTGAETECERGQGVN